MSTKHLFKRIGFIAFLLLTGCTYNLTLMQRGTGEIATGTAERPARTVTITLKGKVYKGTYAYVQNAAFGTFNSFGGAQPATFGSAVAVSGAVNGTIIASSDDGSSLHCNFSFAGSSGVGICEDNAKHTYDLQISQ